MDRVAAERQVRDLSASCLKNMGLKLSGPVGKNYKDLAGSLGFSISDVDRFELEDKSNPGLILLQKWAQQENTTAAVLRYHLKAIGRDDVIKILDNELEDPVDLYVVIRNESNSEVIFTGAVSSFGYCTIRQALESEPKLTIPVSELRHDSKCPDPLILEQKVARFRGRQLSLKYIEVKTPVEETLSQLSLSPEKRSPAEMETLQSESMTIRTTVKYREDIQPKSEYQALIPPETQTTENIAKLAEQKRASDLSAVCLRNMALKLSEQFGSNYKELARRLGWNCPDDDDEELVCGPNPVYALLHKWCHQANATAAQLRLDLQNLVRNDVIDILDAELRDPVTLEVIVKHRLDSQEEFNIAAYGCCTVKEAMQSRPDIRLPFSNLHHEYECYNTSVLLQKASLFKEKRLTFFCLEKPLWSGQDVLGYHPDADSQNKITRLMEPYIGYDGAYIVRPSNADPAKRCITLVNKGELVNFKVHSRCVQTGEGIRCEYFLYEEEQSFPSLEELIAYYHNHELCARKGARGQRLTVPILADNN